VLFFRNSKVEKRENSFLMAPFSSEYYFAIYSHDVLIEASKEAVGRRVELTQYRDRE
jgi:hypothetical protein